MADMQRSSKLKSVDIHHWVWFAILMAVLRQDVDPGAPLHELQQAQQSQFDFAFVNDEDDDVRKPQAKKRKIRAFNIEKPGPHSVFNTEEDLAMWPNILAGMLVGNQGQPNQQQLRNR